MDKEQEQFQLLGFLGIFKESIRIILSHPKIFTKISLAFILPLTFITIANNELSKLISNKIFHKDVPSSRLFTSKWMFYWSFEALYFIFIFIIIFSLMSISAVVYTVACIYTGREVTFKEVMTAVPKVWKRLMFTLASNFCIVFAYTFVIVLSSLIIVRGIGSRPSDMTIAIIVIFTISVVLLSGGIIYLTITWQLANVISVMEECYGFQAMKKSRQLIKGNLGNAIGIFLVLGLCSVPIIALNQQLVRGNDVGVWLKILCAILIMVLNPLITLYGLVVNTVFYCVCKSYHQENIDKSNLVDHLEGFLGANVPLLKDVEIV